MYAALPDVLNGVPSNTEEPSSVNIDTVLRSARVVSDEHPMKVELPRDALTLENSGAPASTRTRLVHPLKARLPPRYDAIGSSIAASDVHPENVSLPNCHSPEKSTVSRAVQSLKHVDPKLLQRGARTSARDEHPENMFELLIDVH